MNEDPKNNKFNDRRRLQYQGLLDSELLDLELQNSRIISFEFVDNFIEKDDSFVEEVKHFRLGKRVEELFAIYINRSKRYEIIASNIQIYKGKSTLGELDYILFDHKSNRAIHVELVYKFYCYDPTVGNNELDRWIGPNRKDSLVIKKQKLTNRQFPLLAKEETQLALSHHDVELEQITQQLCFFAQLYIPYALAEKAFPIVNPLCIVGYWEKYRVFFNGIDNNYSYYIPDKQDWLIDPNENLNWKSYEHILPILNDGFSEKRALLLWIKKHDNKLEKLFLVCW